MNLFKKIISFAKRFFVTDDSINDINQSMIEKKKQRFDEYLSALFKPGELLRLYITYSLQDFKTQFLNSNNSNNEKENRKTFNAIIDNYSNSLQNEIKKKIKGKIKKIMLKLLIKAFQCIIKFLPLILKFLLIILAIILVICIIWYIFSMFPSLSNLFSFSYGFDKTSYYDAELFQSVKNKELMEENLYERTGETSYYQRFVDADIEDFARFMLPNDLNSENDTRSWTRKVEEAAKEFTGFYSLDSRLTLHDANLNGMSALIQANTISSKLEQSADIQGYLRDYFNKETNFELSNQFLMQLNNKAFANYGDTYSKQLIYPEIFTKPVAYVYDFNRMELLRDYDTNKKQYNYNWSEYTYTTQRILKNHIGKNIKDCFKNFDEIEWAKYYGVNINDGEITKEDEGKIMSFPSPIIWEYVVKDKDDYHLYQQTSNDPAIITNKYNSEYLLFKNDETGEEFIPKFFYKIVGLKNGTFYKNNQLDLTTGSNPDEYIFDGPYMVLNNQELNINDFNSVFDENFKVKKVNNDGNEDINGLWFNIKIPDGYRLIDDVEPIIKDENGVEKKQERTKNEIKVNATYNTQPKKHLQLADLIGSNGDINVSSQNLINYKYFKFKTISESYRNKQDYVDGWATYITNNKDFFNTYSDRSFWGALWNRVSSVGSIFNNIDSVEDDLDDASSEDKALFKMIKEYPKEVLNLSLYLYEQDYKKQHVESNETWKYDYSVNNYFRTDNVQFKNLQDYQKFFYVLEELKISKENPDSPTSEIIKQALKDFPSIEYEGQTLPTDIDTLINDMTENMTNLDGETRKALQVISNKMSTRYLNLAQPKMENNEIIGEQVSLFSGKRIGEISLESTLKYNSDLHKEAISFSKLNGKNKDLENDFEFDFSYKTWTNSVKDFWNNLWGEDKDRSVSETITVSADEHSHLQDDYYITDGDLNTYSSNVFLNGEDGNELPLEVKSVRDYGLGSILNYVDSVVVEYQSGMIYDESYLKDEIGSTIKTDYSDVYNTYNVNSSGEIGEGYFPKEMKDQGSDKLIELFAQNNKKELFKSLLESLDSKIIKISSDYDEACKNPDKKGIIEDLQLSINDNLDNISSISINGTFDGATGSGSANATLSGNIGNDGFGNVSISGVNGDVYFNGDENDTFKFYTPALTNPSSISQLVLPKRFYRSWLERGTENQDTIKGWISLKLRKNDFIYKSDGLPSLIDVIAGNYRNKGINNNYMSSYDLARNNKKLNGSISDYAKQLYNEDYNKKNFTEGLTGSYEYIKEDDLKKVYLMDEVVTFAGKFMYTYKDTLLTTTASADENMPKSVIGSYATDRYVFLDSWDVKLLTDRIAKVDFMLFSVEGKINYNGQWIYISDYIDKVNDEKSSSFFGFSKHFKSTFNDLQDTTKATYMFAVPSNFSDQYFESTGTQLNDIFKDSTDNNANINKSKILMELEEYTQFIYNGFLFDQSLNSQIFTDGGNVGSNIKTYNLINGNTSWKANQDEIDEFREYVKNNAKVSMSDVMGDMDFESIEDTLPSYDIHEFVESNYGSDSYYPMLKTSINKYLNDFGSGKFSDYTENDWVSYINSNYKDFGVQNVWATKSKLKNNVKKFLNNIDKDDFEDGEVENYIINEMVAGSVYGYCNMHYHKLIDNNPDSPGTSYQDDLESCLSEMNGSTGNFILDIFGEIQSYLNKLAQKVLDLITEFEITSEDFNVKCVKFKNNLIGSQFIQINENDIKSYFNKYVKVLDSQMKNLGNEDYFNFSYQIKTGNGEKENGIGRCFTTKKVIRYTLRVSDEIALDINNGRFSSQLSGYSSGQIGADISRTDLIQSNTSSYKSGELLYVKSNSNIVNNGGNSSNDFSSTLINSNEFLSIYNSKTSKYENKSLSMEDWNKIWNPQIKVFDNINNNTYINTTMKEYAFGAIKNNVDNNGNIYISKGNMNGNYVKEIKNLNNYFFFPNSRINNNYQFMDTLFNKTNVLKGFKLQTELSHPLFFIDNNGIEHNNFKEKTESINLTDVKDAINPSDKIDKTAFTETLDYFYNDKVSTLAQNTVKNGKYLGTLKEEDKNSFHITGFVLVPRIVDRRDEPTIYPLYRYWGGAKKKIEPTEKTKYFEGQTYENWLDKMNINEDSNQDDLTYFKKEKDRLSKYLKSYLQNFETYLPYNIISDSDLEIRGTAGYGDLMTNYTLTPQYTTEYSQLFENEASKAYWNDILERYDISKKDLAQLLQGVAEKSLSTAGEDSLRLLRTGSSPDNPNLIKKQRIISQEELSKPKPAYSQENIDALNEAILTTVSGSSLTSVKLKTESGNEETYRLPILGISAIDDLTEGELDNNDSAIISDSNDFNDFAYIGNFTSGDIVNKNGLINEFMNQDLEKIKDKKGIVLMLGGKDVATANNTVDTAEYRNLISKIKSVNKQATIYVVLYPGFANNDNYDEENNISSFKNGISPSSLGASNYYKTYDELNGAMKKYNMKLKTALISDSVKVIDLSDYYGDGLGGINEEYCDGLYFNDKDLKETLKVKLFGNTDSNEKITLDNHTKSTRVLKPNNSNVSSYEVDLNISKNSNDDRLNQKLSVQFMSFRLYKMINSTGDLLKGVYSYYYGVDFVQSLISVTSDNAKNLIENPEHGLWYNPTEEDIKRALGENVILSDEEEGNLRNSFGVSKMKDAFSFVKNIESRKKIVIGATKSKAQVTGQLSGINVENDKAVLPEGWSIIGGDGYEKSFTPSPKITYADANMNPISMSKVDFSDYTYNTSIKTFTNLVKDDGSIRWINSSNYPNRKAIVNSAKTDSTNGLMYVEEDGVKYYLVALGSAFLKTQDDSSIGGKYIVTTDEGNSWYVMTVDSKADQHTDTMNVLSLASGGDNPTTIYQRVNVATKTVNGCACEFYINGPVHKATGNVSWNNYKNADGTINFSGNVVSIVPVDKAGMNNTSDKRDYIDELWESQYLKYQNTGVNLITNHMSSTDIEDLINMTANYRNNNKEQNDYGYTYLDFFKNINKVDEKTIQDFSGQKDSLILNSMRYLGAHYSQGRAKDVSKVGKVVSRFANHDNLTSSASATKKYSFSKWPYGKGFYYVEGEHYYSAVPNLYGMDCSSFASMMYIAMGYEFPASTTSTLRSAFSKYPGNSITSQVNRDPNNLQTGDILITTGHAMLWIGEYTNNYKGLFNEDNLLCNDPTLYWATGKEALQWANANVSGKTNVIIHEGGSYNNHSFVNIKDRPNVLSQGDCKVFRIFNDDIEYSKQALEKAGMLYPTIFTKTTIKNNPYLVEYMENSGILEQELANGMFTMEDVESAKKTIAKSKGDDTDSVKTNKTLELETD